MELFSDLFSAYKASRQRAALPCEGLLVTQYRAALRKLRTETKNNQLFKKKVANKDSQKSSGSICRKPLPQQTRKRTSDERYHSIENAPTAPLYCKTSVFLWVESDACRSRF